MATATKKAPISRAKKSTLQEKTYRLLDYQPLAFMLKTGRNNDLLIFDKAKGYERSIRHCPNERSIFVDDQGSHAVVQPIVFTNGLFHTVETEVSTQKFLEAHPKYGKLYSLIDQGKQAQELVDNEEAILDVKNAIRQKVKEEGGIEELRAVVSVLISNAGKAAKMSVPELKYAAWESAESNINRFINDMGEVTIFDDSGIKREAITQQAFNSGIIMVSADASKIMWSDNKALITMVPTGRSYQEFFADWLSTEEGMQVAVEISKRD